MNTSSGILLSVHTDADRRAHTPRLRKGGLLKTNRFEGVWGGGGMKVAFVGLVAGW